MTIGDDDAKKPLVTVLLPVYNRESVTKTIDSILAQTLTDFELLIVDNASTDNTAEVVRAYDDRRIRLVVNEKNGGQTFSLGRGLSLARGKYIARIDADDIALPDRLEKQVAFLDTHPDYGLCGCWVQYINDNDQLTVTMKMCLTDEGLRAMQKITCGMYHPAAMMRASVLQENGIAYDLSLSMAEDYDIWFRIMQHSKGLNLGEVLLYYRRGSNNDGKKHADVMKMESYMIRQRICDAYAKDERDRERMRQEINLELKARKSVADMLRIHRELLRELDLDVSKNSIDYRIIKRQIYLKTYATCIADNTAWYAKLLNAFYRCLLSARFSLGKKAEAKR